MVTIPRFLFLSLYLCINRKILAVLSSKLNIKEQCISNLFCFIFSSRHNCKCVMLLDLWNTGKLQIKTVCVVLLIINISSINNCPQMRPYFRLLSSGVWRKNTKLLAAGGVTGYKRDITAGAASIQASKASCGRSYAQ